MPNALQFLHDFLSAFFLLVLLLGNS